MNKNNLLYLNLAVDDKDTSLGFANSWLYQFAKEFNDVDVITLKDSTENNNFIDNVKIFGIKSNEKYSKIEKLFQLRKLIIDLFASKKYDFIFSHMSPLLLILVVLFGKKNKIPKILWYTHPEPQELSKKLILFLSLKFSNKVVTASNSSFPYKSKKVHVIGHGIDAKLFFSKRKTLENQNFLMLSRVTKSKNLEIVIDSFLKSKFNVNSLTIVGEYVTQKDQNYKNYLIKKYENYENIIFKGKIPHNELSEFLKTFSFHINATPNGFYDKSVLETLTAGIFNLYSNSDYDNLFKKSSIQFTKFELNIKSLKNKLDLLYDLDDKVINDITQYAQENAQEQNLESISQRVLAIAQS